ncbi:pilus assembly protein [Pontibacterium granulatum]|uniref:Flp family type IVb pilin n=1 Tax=Pontibacterium granulatum TaxID=2036029 RepID=UPI00249A8C1A|nr:pilus assembly protein [Pontibacterium granulatum]MDI3323806.1 pilus assembly protein [Pontibacterium granulatum]
MMTLKEKLIAFVKEEEGLTTVEYAVAGSLIAAAVITAFDDLGAAVCGVITGIKTTLETGNDYVYAACA